MHPQNFRSYCQLVYAPSNLNLDPPCMTACSTLVFFDNLLLEEWNKIVRDTHEAMVMSTTSTWPAPKIFHLLRAKLRKPLLPSMLYYPIIHSSSYTPSIPLSKLLNSSNHITRGIRCATKHLQLRVPYYKGCELEYMSLKSN